MADKNKQKIIKLARNWMYKKELQWERNKPCVFGFHKWRRLRRNSAYWGYRSQCPKCCCFKTRTIERWLAKIGIILEPPGKGLRHGLQHNKS